MRLHSGGDGRPDAVGPHEVPAHAGRERWGHGDGVLPGGTTQVLHSRGPRVARRGRIHPIQRSFQRRRGDEFGAPQASRHGACSARHGRTCSSAEDHASLGGDDACRNRQGDVRPAQRGHLAQRPGGLGDVAHVDPWASEMERGLGVRRWVQRPFAVETRRWTSGGSASWWCGHGLLEITSRRAPQITWPHGGFKTGPA